MTLGIYALQMEYCSSLIVRFYVKGTVCILLGYSHPVCEQECETLETRYLIKQQPLEKPSE